MKVTMTPVAVRLGKGTERFRYQWISGDHPNFSSIKINQSTEKSCCHSKSNERPSANASTKTHNKL